MKVKEAYNKLNPEQKSAVLTKSKRLLIIAGAGSGKTSTIVVRLARHLLSDKFKPQEVVALTFTNKAGGELKERVESLVGEDLSSKIQVGTFHSYCVKLLRKYHSHARLPQNFSILDEADKKKLLTNIWFSKRENAITKLKLHGKSTGTPKQTLDLKIGEIQARYANVKDSIKLAADRIGYMKNRGLDFEWLKGDLVNRVSMGLISSELASFAFSLCKEYERVKNDQHILDFDDLIIKVVYMLKQDTSLRRSLNRQIRALLIDEFQDTNVIQYSLMKLLIGPDTFLTVIGDEDQLIYSWRGAILNNILSFCERENGVRIKLEKNYRSSSNIINAANGIIRNNRERLGKTLTPTKGLGELVSATFFHNSKQEAQSVLDEIVNLSARGIKPSQIAILYRSKAMATQIEAYLHKKNIPSITHGGLSFWERQEIKDMLAILKWINNPNDSLSITRVLERLRIGFGDKKAHEIRTLVEMNDITYDAALEQYCNDGNKSKFKAELRKIIFLKNTAHDFYVSNGLGAALQYIYSNFGFLDAYAKKDDDEQLGERSLNMQQLIEIGFDFNHEEQDRLGMPIDDLSVFVSYAELQLESQLTKNHDSNNAVSLMTMHASKGLEYDYVFVIGMEQAFFPAPNKTRTSEVEEERRLAYVAITRAKVKAYLSGARHRLGRESKDVSRFIIEIPNKHKLFVDKSTLDY